MNLQWNGCVVIPNGIKSAFNKSKEGFKGYMFAVFSIFKRAIVYLVLRREEEFLLEKIM
jgi:hypothetical protein